jgi:hypothetical protein
MLLIRQVLRGPAKFATGVIRATGVIQAVGTPGAVRQANVDESDILLIDDFDVVQIGDPRVFGLLKLRLPLRRIVELFQREIGDAGIGGRFRFGRVVGAGNTQRQEHCSQQRWGIEVQAHRKPFGGENGMRTGARAG